MPSFGRFEVVAEVLEAHALAPDGSARATLSAAEGGAPRSARARSTPSSWSEACLGAIDQVEPAVKAWVHLDREGARRTARERAAQAAAGAFVGPLHGVPVALKDIFDVAGMPTRAGAKAFAHRRPDTDAASVARLRAAGAVILGKVTTTTFALMDPSPTGNPWNRRAHARRLVLGLGGGGGRAHGAAGARLADGGLGAPAGRLLRRGGLQAHPRPHQRRRRRPAVVEQ